MKQPKIFFEKYGEAEITSINFKNGEIKSVSVLFPNNKVNYTFYRNSIEQNQILEFTNVTGTIIGKLIL